LAEEVKRQKWKQEEFLWVLEWFVVPTGTGVIKMVGIRSEYWKHSYVAVETV